MESEGAWLRSERIAIKTKTKSDFPQGVQFRPLPQQDSIKASTIYISAAPAEWAELSQAKHSMLKRLHLGTDNLNYLS